mmetsp:Transcript_26642/g.53379  ORF Transcript_26642/g.53379 Transcript_26642/m.53379 type:complete len:1010 (-) Transcript_26642:117-3146(-)
MKLSQAAIFLTTVAISHIDQSHAVNFIVIQPDDLQFYDDWSPPPYLPWNRRYPGKSYPGSSTLPWINKLRSDGLEMTSAYTAAPKCGTSRYSTVTGRYPSRSSHGRMQAQNTGVTSPSDASIPNTKLRDILSVTDGQDCTTSNLAQVLKANDFETGMVGKWHLSRTNTVGDSIDGVRAAINECGFNDVEAMYPDNMDPSKFQGWYDSSWSHNMEYVAHKAVEFIEDNVDKNWFLYMNPTVPHSPDVAEAMTKNCLITPDGDFSTTNNPNGVAEPTDWCVEGMTTPDADGNCDCMAYRETIKTRAAGSVANEDLGSIWVDDAIGAVYKALERTGQLSETFILFQLDHGQAEKDKIWEGGIRIPQFIHYPDGLGTAGRSFHGMVSTIDIAPTILDFAGLTEEYSMDGKSWKGAIDDDITGDEWKANRCLAFESGTERAVRCGCHKYVMMNDSSPEKLEAESNSWWTGNEALFNLCDASGNYIVADSLTPSPEAVNIIDDNQELADQLKALLDCHLLKTNASADPIYQECTLNGDPITTTTVAPGPVAPIGPPQLLSSNPAQNDAVSGDSTVINAKVFDDDIRRVRFRVQLPNSNRLSFTDGVKVSSNGDESDYEFAVDTTMKGKYGIMLELIDFSGNTESIPSDGSWMTFLVAENAADVVNSARAEIATIISDHPTNLAAKFVRMGFHDCVGGCDGCVDMLNGDNFGLDVPIEALQPVVDLYSHTDFGVTRADLWVLAALEGASGSQDTLEPREFAMEWVGRPTCEDLNSVCVDNNGNDNGCSEDRGPHRELPSPDLDTKELLAYFQAEFDYQEAWETVAIMGAHSLGTLSRENSGFNGINGWLGNTRDLNNAYYDDLMGGASDLDDFETLMESADWEQVYVNNEDIGTPNRWEYERGVDPHFVMLNTDIALVRDLSEGLIGDEGEVSECQVRCGRRNGNGCALPRCPHAEETWEAVKTYKFDNEEFLADFEVSFKKMLTTGAETDAGCASSLCTVPTISRRNLKKNYLRK